PISLGDEFDHKAVRSQPAWRFAGPVGFRALLLSPDTVRQRSGGLGFNSDGDSAGNRFPDETERLYLGLLILRVFALFRPVAFVKTSSGLRCRHIRLRRRGHLWMLFDLGP